MGKAVAVVFIGVIAACWIGGIAILLSAFYQTVTVDHDYVAALVCIVVAVASLIFLIVGFRDLVVRYRSKRSSA